jgi:cysteinyl-tRNA synthetase
MSRKYLGDTFDIHGGGIDNIFPHNECEIAQSEAANGVPFARYWLLVGSLTVNGQKMSKSLGNFVTIKDALARYRPEVIRTFMFQAHYTNPIDFSDEALRAAERGWERLASAARLVRNRLRNAPEEGENTFAQVIRAHREQFIAAMDDDFNAPAALGVLQAFTGEVNKLLNSGEPVNKATLAAIEALYSDLGGQVLGIIPKDEAHGVDMRLTDALIRLLIEIRAQARAEKNFARADQIRNQLRALGVILEDRPEGTTYRLE